MGGVSIGSVAGNMDVGGDITAGDKITQHTSAENSADIKSLIEAFEARQDKKNSRSLAEGIVSIAPGIATNIIAAALLQIPNIILKMLK